MSTVPIYLLQHIADVWVARWIVHWSGHGEDERFEVSSRPLLPTYSTEHLTSLGAGEGKTDRHNADFVVY